jgi:hypothetical protein
VCLLNDTTRMRGRLISGWRARSGLSTSLLPSSERTCPPSLEIGSRRAWIMAESDELGHLEDPSPHEPLPDTRPCHVTGCDALGRDRHAQSRPSRSKGHPFEGSGAPTRLRPPIRQKSSRLNIGGLRISWRIPPSYRRSRLEIRVVRQKLVHESRSKTAPLLIRDSKTPSILPFRFFGSSGSSGSQRAGEHVAETRVVSILDRRVWFPALAGLSPRSGIPTLLSKKMDGSRRLHTPDDRADAPDLDRTILA